MSAGSIEDDLACLGGAPAFVSPLPVGQMYFPSWSRYADAMRGIFDRGWYTNHGPLARELEERLAAFFGVRHAIAVSNATVGLIMALKCLDLTGKVVVPSFTFIASAQAATWAGLDVVFCDVDPDTHQITPEAIEAVMDDDVSAIVAVNLWGGTCIPASVEAYAQQNDVRLIFDSAHGVGVHTDDDLSLGGFGDAEVFSFHATKILSATEGGCVCTDDDDLAAKLRNMRSSYGSGPPAAVPLTSNGRFSEAQAAIAMMSLEDFPANRLHNDRIHRAYAEGVGSIQGLNLVVPANTSASNYQYAVIDVDAGAYGITRDTLLRSLHAENVISRRYFYPGVHRLVPYANQGRPALPVTEELCERLIQLPVGALVSEESAARITDLLVRIGKEATAVSAAVSRELKMRAGIMQPYFFPYLGYFALIDRCDTWVVFDVTQYTPKTWMNRNRVLHPNTGWNWVTIPLANSSQSITIREARVLDKQAALTSTLGKLSHYRRKAPHWRAVEELVRHGFDDAVGDSLVALNVATMTSVCEYLGLAFAPRICSELDVDLESVDHAGGWAPLVARAVGADGYLLNPIGGSDLFTEHEFRELGITLQFLDFPTFEYDTAPYAFEPGLSVLDVLMWNDPKVVRAALAEGLVKSAVELLAS